MTSGDVRFAELYDRHHRQITAYCGRRVASDRVEDTVAAVFLTAWRRIDDVPDGDGTLSWLYGVAYKVLGHEWRSVSRRRRLKSKLSAVGVDHSPSVEEQVVVRVEAIQVRRALEHLKPTDREILRLAAWEDLSHADIAETLGIGVGAVRQRFYEAKKNLTTQYNKLEKKRVNTPAAQKGGTP